MTAAMRRRLAALEGANPPAPEDDARMSWAERYMRLIALPMPRRPPKGPALAPAEAYRLMCGVLP